MTPGNHARKPSRLRMPRRRGAVAGPLIMLLGAWGALIPFFGHSFSYGYTPSNTWTWTAARGWLEVLPGAVAFVGGAIITTSAHRVTAVLGGWLAAASGSWFVLGRVVSPWWSAGFAGTPVGSASQGVWEQIGMFTGVGMLIVYLSALTLGRVSIVGHKDMSTSVEQLEAIKRIEARSIPGETPRTVDLTGAERPSATTGEPSLHDSPR